MRWQSATSAAVDVAEVVVAAAVELVCRPERPVERWSHTVELGQTKMPGSAGRRLLFRGLVIEEAVVGTAAESVRKSSSDSAGRRRCCSKTARAGTARVGTARVGTARREQTAADRSRWKNSRRDMSSLNRWRQAGDAASWRCLHSHAASAAGARAGSVKFGLRLR